MIEIIPNWHPIIVHYPIAYVTAAVFCMVVGMMFRVKPWAQQAMIFGRWMLWAGAIFACVAVVFGWLAYNSVNHDDAGHLAMTIHRNWALTALGSIVIVTLLDVRSWHRGGTTPSYGFLSMLVVAWLLLVSAAWRGGEAVYRHGLGVMSIPAVEEHDHASGEINKDGHKFKHSDSESNEHPHIASSNAESFAVSGKDIPLKKTGHTHKPGAPSHQDGPDK